MNYATKKETSDAIQHVETQMKANVEKFKLSVLNDLDKSQTKNKDLIDEAMKTFSVKLNEKTELVCQVSG